jgi:hypothetical protein
MPRQQPAVAVHPMVEAMDRNTAMLRHVLQELTQLPNGLRQTLADHLWASIPETVFEYGWNLSVTSISAHRETNGLRRITGAYTWCPSGQTGYLQLGNTTLIPVPSGPFYMGPLSIVLEETDIRTLYSGLPGTNTGVAGFMFVGLWGQQLPRFGQLAGG